VGESRTAIERGCEENAVVGGLGQSPGVGRVENIGQYSLVNSGDKPKLELKRAVPKLMDLSPQDKITVHSGGVGRDDGRVVGRGEAHAEHQCDGGDGELQHQGGVPDHDEDAREGQGDVHRVEGVVHRPQQLRQTKQGGRHQVLVRLVQLRIGEFLKKFASEVGGGTAYKPVLRNNFGILNDKRRINGQLGSPAKWTKIKHSRK
jgi:hypothetical protein